MQNSEKNKFYRCSFCLKYQDQVKKIIVGTGVCICDECVLLCVEILVSDEWGSTNFRRTIEELLQDPDEDVFIYRRKTSNCVTVNKPDFRWEETSE